jgi:hypothetical protein
MISTLCFSLSALCVAGMFSPRKTAKPARQDYTYFVCEATPLPTWKRKTAPMARVAALRA